MSRLITIWAEVGPMEAREVYPIYRVTFDKNAVRMILQAMPGECAPKAENKRGSDDPGGVFMPHIF